MTAERRSVSERLPEAMSLDRFVGRERELAELHAALGEALSGHGRLFFLAGEPGIGKTRLAEEVAGKATRSGARVLWGRAWESEGAPPYWPWIQILRSLVEADEPDILRQWIGTGLPHVVQLLPELRQILPKEAETSGGDGGTGAFSDPARQRFQLFDAVARFVANTTSGRPHVFVLDDLQWADVPSLLLLRFLARETRESPVLTLGTYRGVEARSRKQVSGILPSVAREGRVVHLGGLTEPAVGRMMATWNRERASDELISRVYRATGGNPFFVDGILRLLAADRDHEQLDALPIPDEVRGAVRQRLAPLEQDLRDLLTTAAVLGREFDQTALAAVCGMAPENLVALLEQTSSLEILAGSATPHRWRFVHDLFREVLYGDLPPPERMKLHERVGSALETFYGDAAETHSPELALHFLSALPAADARRAIDYGTLAARQAMSSYAWEEAVQELDRVVAALESNPAASERERLELLLDLGKAIWHSEDSARYREVFGEAIELARKLSLPRELALAVLGFVGVGDASGLEDEAAVALIEDALSLLGDTDLVLRGRLLVRLSWERTSLEEDFRKTAEECVAIARRAEDPVLLVHALRQWHAALLGSPQDLPERIAIGDEMLEIAGRTGHPEVTLTAGRPRIVNLLEAGDTAGLDVVLVSHRRRAREVGDPMHLWFSFYIQATRATMAGHWQAAERLSAEARAAGLATHPKLAANVFSAQQYQLHYEQGQIANFMSSLDENAEHFPKLLAWQCAAAAGYLDLGRTRDARTRLEMLTARGVETLPVNGYLAAILAWLSVVVSVLGDVARAEALYARLLPFAGLNVIVGYGAVCLGAADRFLGVLASTLSRWDDAERHFEAAFEMNRRMGMGPMAARALYDYASMLLRRRKPGDEARAEPLLRDAVAAARDFGMARLLEQTEEALGKLGASAVHPSSTDVAEGATTNAAVLRREGDFWTIGWQGKSFRLKDLKGLGYIQRLVGEPGRELHCLDLLGGETVDLGDAGETLDTGAKAAYRQRLEDLKDELAEAERNDDTGRAAKAREEMELLGQELSSAIGLGGRDRRAARNVERARIRLTRVIRDAITRIRKHDAALGQHLSTAIRTGAFCSYTPDPTSPVTWRC